ncbi:MAG TPA: energy transducer TonB [Pyrinomonadaceae bacterium]|jgi:TonB family protein|nr:energy transducer TonB [Pyrinomonadaceae bacterium]
MKLDGVAGKEYVLRNERGHTVARFFSTSTKIYLFEAWGSPLVSGDQRMMRFLDSIKLTGRDGRLLNDGDGELWQPPDDYQNAPPTEILSGKEVSTKAVVTSKPEPTYTEEARQKQETGTVVIRCVFRSSGAITNLKVVSGLQYGLTEQALSAARQIKFLPAGKGGHFVSMWMELQYNFNLY